MGLAAMVVNGDLFVALPWPPKPKSMSIALAVAVVWGGLSSNNCNTAGSNVVSDVQSMPSVYVGDVTGAGGEKADDCTGDIDVGELYKFSDDCPDPEATGAVAPDVFGTVNVNAACLSETFSSCSRANKSLRLPFSEVAS